MTLTHCLIGSRTVIHAGARIGQDGFGFAMGPKGHVKVPQIGRVIIEDDVEVGANSTIDRGSGPDTVIGRGCKIDNLVMIAHNVKLGPWLRRRGPVRDFRQHPDRRRQRDRGPGRHRRASEHRRRYTVRRKKRRHERTWKAGQTMGGAPAMPIKQWLRQVAAMNRLIKAKEAWRE